MARDVTASHMSAGSLTGRCELPHLSLLISSGSVRALPTQNLHAQATGTA